MSTYPGMTLRGEVRESVSLDEDDLSDVEDEVFIRDGKRGYKVTFCFEQCMQLILLIKLMIVCRRIRC